MLALMMAASQTGPIDYVSSAFTAAGTSVSKPSGVEVGDVVFVWAMDINSAQTLTTSGGSAWSSQDVGIAAGSTNANATLYWKILNATDVANAWALSGSGAEDGIQAVRYRGNGADAVTVKSAVSAGAGGTTFSLTGFSRAAGHFGAIAFFGAPDNAGVVGIVVPTGFTERRRDSSGSPDFAGIVADALGNYVDGAAVQFTNCDAATTEYGILVEVTGS